MQVNGCYVGSGSKNAIFGYDRENGQPEPTFQDSTGSLMYTETGNNAVGWHFGGASLYGIGQYIIGDGVNTNVAPQDSCFKMYRPDNGQMFAIDLENASRTTRMWNNNGTGSFYNVASLDNVGFNFIKYGGKKHTYGSSAPTSGTWEVGDIVYNIAPTAGGYMGWTCITAGTSGAWKGFGLIET